MTAVDIGRVFDDLRLSVLERGWLSSNNVVLRPRDGSAVTVVDTGYDTHSAQTVALVGAAAGPSGVELVVNTHLHSDHCGGNAALQAAWRCETWVPAVSLDAVRAWDAARLSYAMTDQRCGRFGAERGVDVGETLRLAGERWQAFRAPGHDPQALMFWHAESRVLIAGDALWEARLAIIFPELEGREGFAGVREVLDAIEALGPSIVVPGHGAPFSDVPRALSRSRARLAQFEADPKAHFRYAARALAMFHMLEQRQSNRVALEAWLVSTPIFASLLSARPDESPAEGAAEVVRKLISDGILQLDGHDCVSVR